MNYIYQRMLDEDTTAVFDKEQFKKFDEYVTNKYKVFYENKIGYDVKKDGDKFIVTLFDTSVISMKDIVLDIVS
tara:strand:+ start:344 stop:565 length:222 start_codon:yes stop_codon:yes gene_type:complete